MKKEAMYKTAITVLELPDIPVGSYVSIVRYHDYNGKYTIRSVDGVLQCMVTPETLTGFCL